MIIWIRDFISKSDWILKFTFEYSVRNKSDSIKLFVSVCRLDWRMNSFKHLMRCFAEMKSANQLMPEELVRSSEITCCVIQGHSPTSRVRRAFDPDQQSGEPLRVWERWDLHSEPFHRRLYLEAPGGSRQTRCAWTGRSDHQYYSQSQHFVNVLTVNCLRGYLKNDISWREHKKSKLIFIPNISLMTHSIQWDKPLEFMLELINMNVYRHKPLDSGHFPNGFR